LKLPAFAGRTTGHEVFPHPALQVYLPIYGNWIRLRFQLFPSYNTGNCFLVH
jgi:hypothetical protein